VHAEGVTAVADTEPTAGSEERPEPEEGADEAVDPFRTIGKQLKLLRERAGLTQRELGKALG
jgi:hypothetical protein